MAWVDLVLYVRACEDCPAVPVLYLCVKSEVFEFFSRRPEGWTFEEWVRDKLENMGIRIPKEFFVEHPAFASQKGFGREVLTALPEVFLQ